MKISILKQFHKLIFFMILSGSLESQHFSLKDHLYKINNFYEKTDEEIEDEKLLAELWSVADDFYKKIITVTALYFSGVLMNSDQLQKEIMFELGKHILYSGQIFALYVPKLLYNPHISWRIKARRCAYVSCLLILVAVWMQKIYNPSVLKNNSHPMPTQNFSSTLPQENSNYSSSRPRPSLS